MYESSLQRPALIRSGAQAFCDMAASPAIGPAASASPPKLMSMPSTASATPAPATAMPRREGAWAAPTCAAPPLALPRPRLPGERRCSVNISAAPVVCGGGGGAAAAAGVRAPAGAEGEPGGVSSIARALSRELGAVSWASEYVDWLGSGSGLGLGLGAGVRA